MTEPVFCVKDLSISFKLNGKWCQATQNVNFDLMENETLCIVGESGCGKSITAMSCLGLLPKKKNIHIEGQVLYKGVNLLDLTEKELNDYRGDDLSMIFQEPMTSLNPVLTVGEQITESLLVHKSMTKAQARETGIELLNKVKIPEAEKRFSQYPHQFSGGMRQRVMIAIALACKPTVLFADEPTTALDVTIQAQVLHLLKELRRETKMSMVMITHDMGVVASVADKVLVMYGGQVIENSSCKDLFEAPNHPYTKALLNAIPRPDRHIDHLTSIPGQVPTLAGMPSGCRFSTRCELVSDQCAMTPDVNTVAGQQSHHYRCWNV
ncbi:ABC transporter ATP-binding protein [Terasakiella pusilla]|uniref:ABC transporter ATP-binding protein n=1 Tax=Terasakiella pusilla TaxID=64973 RepID=UPI00048BEE5E|nr:ABC transporter ATP-binding protein [Terasakiella pusilla]